jgi:alpha-beta hydrolase superfamily lysophospholipase
MTLKHLQLKAPNDHHMIHYSVLKPQNVRACVVMVHGMMEHQGRYRSFRETLAQAGLMSVALDVRGHGKSIDAKSPKGHYADKQGWDVVMSDLEALINTLELPTGLPLMLFGHSLGSVMVRSYVLRHPDLNLAGIVLSGSPNFSPALALVRVLIRATQAVRGVRHISPGLTNALLITYRAAVKNAKTKWDWLSYSEDNVKNYMFDANCGFPFTVASLDAMIGGLMEVYHAPPGPKRNVPVYFISGEDDPAHQPGGLIKAAQAFKRAGFSDVSYGYVSQARHEFLQEANVATTQSQLVERLLEWL